MVPRQSDDARSRIAHACPDCGRAWAMRGSKAPSSSWVFWCRFCEWQDVRTPALEGSRHSDHNLAARPSAPSSSHRVHLYGRDIELIASVEEHLATGWARGGSGIVVATAAHRSALQERLVARNMVDAVANGRLIQLDAEDTLALFMRDGMPIRELFNETVGSMVRELAAEGPLYAFGEMVDVLWARGHAAGALELERVWGELQQNTSFSLLCGYAESHVDAEGRAAIARVHDHLAAA